MEEKDIWQLNRKRFMKLKDLLKERDKLRKYDELREWEEYFGNDELYLSSTCALLGKDEKIAVLIPDCIKQLIIDAIDAEINKMEEE